MTDLTYGFCLQASASYVNQNGMMRYSTTVPSDSDTHDDFKPTQKVPSGSTDSLKDIVENVSCVLFCSWLELFADGVLAFWVCIRM